MKRYGNYFPFSWSYNYRDENQLFGKCSIWSIITSFTNIKFNELRGNNINTLMNTITLDATAHRFFGELYVWFEAVPVCNILCILPMSDLYLVTLQRVGLTLTKLGRLMSIFFTVREMILVVFKLYNFNIFFHIPRPRYVSASRPPPSRFACHCCQSCPWGRYKYASQRHSREVPECSCAIGWVRFGIPWWAASCCADIMLISNPLGHIIKDGCIIVVNICPHFCQWLCVIFKSENKKFFGPNPIDYYPILSY